MRCVWVSVLTVLVSSVTCGHLGQRADCPCQQRHLRTFGSACWLSLSAAWPADIWVSVLTVLVSSVNCGHLGQRADCSCQQRDLQTFGSACWLSLSAAWPADIWVSVLTVLVSSVTCGQKILGVADDHKHSCTSYTASSTQMYEIQLCRVSGERFLSTRNLVAQL